MEILPGFVFIGANPLTAYSHFFPKKSLIPSLGHTWTSMYNFLLSTQLWGGLNFDFTEFTEFGEENKYNKNPEIEEIAWYCLLN